MADRHRPPRSVSARDDGCAAAAADGNIDRGRGGGGGGGAVVVAEGDVVVARTGTTAATATTDSVGPSSAAEAATPAASAVVVIRIPADETRPVESIEVGGRNDEQQQRLEARISRLLLSPPSHDGGNRADEPADITNIGDEKDESGGDDGDDAITSATSTARRTLLLRPTEDVPFTVYAYHHHLEEEDYYDDYDAQQRRPGRPNVRATRFAMSCGLLSARFYGDVALSRRMNPLYVLGNGGRTGKGGSTAAAAAETSSTAPPPLSVWDVQAACCYSPDLRRCILEELAASASDGDGGDDDAPYVPDWLANAAMHNYRDQQVLARLSKVMTTQTTTEVASDESGTGTSSDDDDSDGSTEAAASTAARQEGVVAITTPSAGETDGGDEEERRRRHVVATTVPLCLHCRRPADEPCANCSGAYFCSSDRNCRNQGYASAAYYASRRRRRLTEPMPVRLIYYYFCSSPCVFLSFKRWSHRCFCGTWKIYVDRRRELSTFPAGIRSWTDELVDRAFQLSDQPYEEYMFRRLGIAARTEPETPMIGWWSTELGGGWAGGEGDGAKSVDVTFRRSFLEGFYPITDFPPERTVTREDLEATGLTKRNEVNLPRLNDWDEYYRLRRIPSSSPVALLLTFPLTLYYSIVEYGEVPCTVAKMLKRPLRVHIVGAEKELGFLDLFKEVAFLLSEGIGSCPIELVFVVRDDMLPEKLRRRQDNSNEPLRIDLAENLQAVVVTGTYGDESSLDPNFDCGTGPPDMIVAFNAGLYAYESWRNVILYLHRNRSSTIGVFTDYNEMSASQCASLGGKAARETVRMNPFRQPRAMPVYSMNLPQFSNGFFYVFNFQEMD